MASGGYDATAPGGPDQVMDHDRKTIDESTFNLRLEEMANHISDVNKTLDEKFGSVTKRRMTKRRMTKRRK